MGRFTWASARRTRVNPGFDFSGFQPGSGRNRNHIFGFVNLLQKGTKTTKRGETAWWGGLQLVNLPSPKSRIPLFPWFASVEIRMLRRVLWWLTHPPIRLHYGCPLVNSQVRTPALRGRLTKSLHEGIRLCSLIQAGSSREGIYARIVAR